MTINPHHIAASVSKHFADNLSVATTVTYAGMRIDTRDIDDWVVVRVVDFRKTPERKQNLGSYIIRIRVKIFAKVTDNIHRLYVIQRDVSNVLKHAKIDITNFSTSQTIGFISVFEPGTVDRTRGMNSPKPTQTRHAVVEFTGRAQAL